MRSSLAIRDFSRATHLNIKTLRHYHRVGLLEPAEVDPDTGHRRYGTELIAGHLRRLEVSLARTQEAAASLRDLLGPSASGVPAAVEHRRLAATRPPP
jgi:DNA-binding transcriptional MerR regulator